MGVAVAEQLDPPLISKEQNLLACATVQSGRLPISPLVGKTFWYSVSPSRDGKSRIFYVELFFYLAEVLRAVTHLQVHHAIKLCEDFLIEETTVENCIDVLSLADLFSIPVLEKVCFQFFLLIINN